MKRIAFLLSVLMLFGLTSASTVGQRSRFAQDQHMVHVRELYSVFPPLGYPDNPADLVRPGFPGGIYTRRLMSRVEVALFTNWVMQWSAATLLYSDNFESNMLLKRGPSIEAFAENFWHLEFLVREFRTELIGIGVDYEEYWDLISLLKTTLAEKGIELRDPYNERFIDVPEGHWADEAIHNLRRAGVLYGYPDGEFRPGYRVLGAPSLALPHAFGVGEGV